MNYFDDPHDMKVMVAVLRRALDVVANWPGDRRLGPLLVPPALAAKHGHVAGRHPERRAARRPGPPLLVHRVPPRPPRAGWEASSIPGCGCIGVADLRVADASVMPNVVSGNTNAASIMIGEKAAEMLAADHGVQLTEFVAQPG